MVALDALTAYEPPETGPPQRARDKVDPTASMVKARWKAGSDELLTDRRRYWEHLSFFAGNQWVWWDEKRRSLQNYAGRYVPGTSTRKMTVNRVGPNVISLLSRLLNTELVFEVQPSGAGDDVIAGARLAEAALTATHNDQVWEAARFDATMATVLGGTGAIAFEWDGTAGERLSWDAETGVIVGTGDARLEALNITEFCVEPGVRDWKDARWWMMGLALTPAQAKDRYRLDWMPKSDITAISETLQGRLLKDSGRAQSDRLALVLTMYERPNPTRPKGRYVVVINDTAVVDTEWPFPFEELNLAVFRQQALPSQWRGRTMLEDAIKLQVDYNIGRSNLNEHMRVTGNARLIAPHGAFDEEAVTNNPADILWYTPDVAGAEPRYLQPPQLPRWLTAHVDAIKAEMDDIMYVHATSRGEASFDRASGQALALLAEKDDTPLSPMAQDQARGWEHLSRLTLLCYEDKVIETRVARRRGPQNTPMSARWTGKSLRGQNRVNVPLEVTMPKSRAATQAFVKDLWDRKIITDPRMYAKMVDLSETLIEEIMDADAAKAMRENARMLDGAVEVPEPFDVHPVHIAEHNRTRKSDAYAYASDEVKALIDDHIKFHERLATEEMAQQTQKEGLMPGLSQVAQAHEPAGSNVPPDFEERQSQMDPAQMMQGIVGAMQPQTGENQMPGPTQAPSPGLQGA